MYDNLNRQTAENWLDSSGAVMSSINSVYDVESRLTQQSDGHAGYTYGYDHLNRLTSVADAASGAAPVLLMVGYDADGNLLTRTMIATGDTVNYSWDYRNRLTGITDKTASGAVTQQIQYTYDSFNRRIEKQVDGKCTFDQPHL